MVACMLPIFIVMCFIPFNGIFHSTSYDVMLLVMFVNVKMGGDDHRDEAREGVDQSSNATVRGSPQQRRGSIKREHNLRDRQRFCDHKSNSESPSCRGNSRHKRAGALAQ